MTNSETALTTTNAATPALSVTTLNFESIFTPPSVGTIEELTALFKNDMEQSNIFFRQSLIYYIKTGIDLIAIREKLKPTRGAFGNWLKANKVSRRTVYNYIEVAEWCLETSKEQFVQLIAQITPTAFLEITRLTPEDAFKFIEEKAAEGNPVEKMTVKQEREEIKKYKAKIAQLDNDNQKLQAENDQLKVVNRNLDNSAKFAVSDAIATQKENEKLQAENKQLTDVAHTLRLENEALKDQPPQVIETVKTITPPNYAETVQRAEDLQQQVDQLLARQEDAQKTIADLQDQVLDAVSKQGEPKIEYVDNVPSDYAATKQELETLKAQQENLRVDMAIFQNLNALGAAAKFLLDNQDRLTANLENFISADFTTDNIKQLAQLVTLLVNNVDGDFDI